MITSNQIIKLSEEWFKRVNSIDFYVNPTSSDYLELNKNKVQEIRFIADNRNKNVYIANSFRVVHNDIAKIVNNSYLLEIQKSPFNQDFSWLLQGIAEINGDKSKMIYSDSYRYLREQVNYNPQKSNEALKRIYMFFSVNWSWLDRYINVTDWMHNWKRITDEEVANKQRIAGGKKN